MGKFVIIPLLLPENRMVGLHTRKGMKEVEASFIGVICLAGYGLEIFNRFS
jgi:hypothetical protein